MGRGSKPAKSKVGAKRPISTESPKNESAGVHDLEKHLAEAQGQIQARDRELAEAREQRAAAHAEVTESHEQQMATSEILKAIASTPTDLTPVFETILRSAVRLFNAYGGAIRRFDGKLVHLASVTSPNPEADDRLRRMYPHPPDREYAAERPILDGTVAHIPDTEDEPSELTRRLARGFGFRRVLSVPMLREGQIVGVISVTGSEPGPYSARQIALLQTFADQAVIAIENVRLFNETKEALERQTATSEILRVISSSPTDTQPVFDAIARNAVALCGGIAGLVLRYDGEMLHVAGHHEMSPDAVEQVERAYPRPPGRDYPPGRALLERHVVHIPDLQAATEFTASTARDRGVGSMLVVPLLREGEAVGVISLARDGVGPFSAQQIEVLQTFADQAVIAIENVRLFTELQEKNTALTTAHAQVTESLDQQTATAEILRVISQSPTDVQPVFDAIASSAVRLCESTYGIVHRFDGATIEQPIATYNVTDEQMALYRQIFPLAASMETALGESALTRRTVHVEDTLTERRYMSDTQAKRVAREVLGYRSLLVVPMVHRDQALGIIVVWRREQRPFSRKQIALVETFADQAVIAIENVRLFNETKEALEQRTATSEVLRVIASSPTELQPVVDTMAESVARLCAAYDAVIWRLEGDGLRVVAHHGPVGQVGVGARVIPVLRGTVTGRTVLDRQMVHVTDLQAEMEDFPEGSAFARQFGHRSIVSVPLLREGVAIGVIALRRAEVQPFTEKQIDLLKTFADQAVIAIENVRLFKELDAANRGLAAASQHKSEFLANMSHELRTPLNAIIGFSEVLAEKMFGELNEKQEEYSKDIHASGQHLLSLINDILDLSKIEAGRMELELSDFHLPTAFDSALTLVRERAGRRGIALRLSIDDRLGQMRADERKVRQVVLNLLSNAIKFTPEGGRIDVAAVAKDGAVEVSVSDTGVGIAPEDQEAVFEEFRQVGTADKKVEGTGLGLTLCRKFVELHGGRIWVKSELGTGSAFTFTIPVRHD